METKPTPPLGRPSYYGQRMKQTAVYLTPEMIDWLKSQGGMGEVVRGLIDQAMKAGDKNGK
jgi:hypothetical protein